MKVKLKLNLEVFTGWNENQNDGTLVPPAAATGQHFLEIMGSFRVLNFSPLLTPILFFNSVCMEPWTAISVFLKESSDQIIGLVQDCSNSSALAMELLQSCAKLSKFRDHFVYVPSQ